jgi:hypothetical protein
VLDGWKDKLRDICQSLNVNQKGSEKKNSPLSKNKEKKKISISKSKLSILINNTTSFNLI